MIIRKATAADAKTIHDFVLALDREDSEVNSPVMNEQDIQAAGFGDDPLFEAYIAENDDGVATGIVSFFRGYSGWHAKPVAVVHMLYVMPEARNRNVARKLMAKVATIAMERGWARIQLCAEEARPAIRFYESIGLQDCQEKHFIIEGEALLNLVKSVTVE